MTHFAFYCLYLSSYRDMKIKSSDPNDMNKFEQHHVPQTTFSNERREFLWVQ